MIGNMESKVHSFINALYGQIDKMKALAEVIIYSFFFFLMYNKYLPFSIKSL